MDRKALFTTLAAVCVLAICASAVALSDDGEDTVTAVQNGTDPELEYFTVTMDESNYFDYKYVNTVMYPTNMPHLLYSTDKVTWYRGLGVAPQFFEEGTKVYLKGTNDRLGCNTLAYMHFVFNGEVTVSGNIMSLVYGDDFVGKKTIPGDFCFSFLFKDCTKMKGMPVLPATELKPYCYAHMFEGCWSVTEAPDLPATKMADHCYEYMFNGCSKITEAPALPSKDLAYFCYNEMFYHCHRLVKAPALPATDLTIGCYKGMFESCESLVKAPALPATEMKDDCYNGMFMNCAKLANAPQLPAMKIAKSCYANMFDNCTALVKAPDLPATELKDSCYDGMFSGCYSLKEAPVLPATVLKWGCYNCMFFLCGSLERIVCFAVDMKADGCTDMWTVGVAPTGTFVRSIDSDWSEMPTGSGIPLGWKAETLTVIYFDTKGGSEIEPVMVCDGKAVDEPVMPYKKGYRFMHWEIDGKEVSWPYRTTQPTTTMTAVWAGITYMTLDAGTDGESGHAMTYQTSKSPAFLEYPAKKTGYRAEGYHADSASGPLVLKADGSFAGKDVPGWIEGGKWIRGAEMATLYTNWVPEKYNVSFDAGDGFVKTLKMQISYGSAYGDLPVPTRSGYAFEGWFTAEKGGEKVTSSTVVSTSGDRTLHAHWNPEAYVVAFDAEGGKVSPSSTVVRYGSVYGPLPTPERDGFTFAGWFTSKNGGSEITPISKVVVMNGHTLHAHWLEEE